jgi:hypothetical protein
VSAFVRLFYRVPVGADCRAIPLLFSSSISWRVQMATSNNTKPVMLLSLGKHKCIDERSESLQPKMVVAFVGIPS